MISEVVPVKELTAEMKQQMFCLMTAHYENVFQDQFEADLGKKNWVIVLKRGETILGFSTVVSWRFNRRGKSVRIVFSGDTIIEEEHRNSLVFPYTLARLLCDLQHQEPHSCLYWLLTSKGYKTYRAMPVFFRNYFPCPDHALNSFEQSLLRDVVQQTFGERFDAQRWVLRASRGDQRLRPGVASISSANRKRDDIAFFERMNPGHASGDELICFARFHKNNLKPAAWKRLNRSCD